MKIYLDTSVISALFDKNNLERQNLTEEFFLNIKGYKVYISEITLAEINKTPDLRLRDKMLKAVNKFSIFEINKEIERIAKEYIRYMAIPESYKEDSYHIAAAVFNEIDYLLSWNFRHLVKNKTRNIVRMVNTLNKLKEINIITPAELL